MLMATGETELKEMIKKFRKYVAKKKLKLSIEKYKIMTFEKGKRKKKNRVWKWGKKELKKVKEYKYLGFMLERGA